MSRIVDTILVEKKTGNNETYLSVEYPRTGNGYNDLEVIAESIIEYRNNMSTRYSTSKGLSLPTGHIAKLLDKHPKIGWLTPLSETLMIRWRMIYVIVFSTILGIVALSVNMVGEDRNSRMAEYQHPIEYTINYSSTVVENSNVTMGYKIHNYLFNRSTISMFNRTLQNISIYLVSDLPSQLNNHVSHSGFSWFILMAFVAIIALSMFPPFKPAITITRKSFKNIQRLFEVLKQAGGSATAERDRVFYKNEIFAQQAVVDALHSVKNSKLPVSEETPLVKDNIFVG